MEKNGREGAFKGPFILLRKEVQQKMRPMSQYVLKATCEFDNEVRNGEEMVDGPKMWCGINANWTNGDNLPFGLDKMNEWRGRGGSGHWPQFILMRWQNVCGIQFQ
jgi:hypothetical protein